MDEEEAVEELGAGNPAAIHLKSSRYLISYKLCPVSLFPVPSPPTPTPHSPERTGNVNFSATPTSPARCSQRASNTSAPTAVSRRRTSHGDVVSVTGRDLEDGRAVSCVCVWAICMCVFGVDA